MLAKIFTADDPKVREVRIDSLLEDYGLKSNHPDLLKFEDQEKLGVEEVKKIREHLNLKPYSASLKAVVLVSAQNLTLAAQNALLKTLEEPPGEALIILGVDSDQALLPTIISRCQVEYLDLATQKGQAEKFTDQIAKLENLSLEEKFLIIGKTEDKEQFLKELVKYYRDKMQQDPKLINFTKELLQAEAWAKANVNIRAILEYLMLSLG